MRVAAYIRVSTDGQIGEDKFGLTVQKEEIEKYCNQAGLDLVELYADEGLSGASVEKRQALQRLLNSAGSKEFERVIVAKLDRLARDLFSQLWIEKELLKHDIEVYSLSEPYNGHDPVTVAMRQMIGVFAQLEKGRIAERMASGRSQKAKSGGYAGGGAPIGYNSARGSKALEIDADKAKTVQRAFELREQGLSFQKIADVLNGEGHTTAQGKQFVKVQVKRILDRKDFYGGAYKYSGVRSEGKHQPII